MSTFVRSFDCSESLGLCFRLWLEIRKYSSHKVKCSKLYFPEIRIFSRNLAFDYLFLRIRSPRRNNNPGIRPGTLWSPLCFHLLAKTPWTTIDKKAREYHLYLKIRYMQFFQTKTFSKKAYVIDKTNLQELYSILSLTYISWQSHILSKHVLKI